MAGGGHHESVRFDPAIERWSAMRENVYKHFSFTRKATRIVILWGLVFPATIAAISMTYDNKYDWAGKLRGSSLLTKAVTPGPAAAEED